MNSKEAEALYAAIRRLKLVTPFHKTLIVFNAPPSSGKDLICDLLETTAPASHLRFKKKLFDLVKTIYDVTDEQWDSIYTEELKNQPSPLLDGKSPREAMIFVSENVIKPNFGEEYFGRSLAKQALNAEHDFMVCSDSGFLDELVPVANLLGEENIHVVKVYRPDYTFERFNDSRSYINPADAGLNIPVHTVHNDGTVQEYLLKAINTIRQALEEKQ